MADSTSPMLEIPESYRAYKNRGVALYADGHYGTPPATAGVFSRRKWIDVTGNPASATVAEIMDCERFDATAADFPEFRKRRDEWCSDHSSNRWPIVYCSIDPDPAHGVAAVAEAVRAAGQEPVEHWWIAWYTPGGYIPTAQQVKAEIFHITEIEIPVWTIWGCQYADNGGYDASVIYQTPNWA
jgi:hypothetical protein